MTLIYIRNSQKSKRSSPQSTNAAEVRTSVNATEAEKHVTMPTTPLTNTSRFDIPWQIAKDHFSHVPNDLCRAATAFQPSRNKNPVCNPPRTSQRGLINFLLRMNTSRRDLRSVDMLDLSRIARFTSHLWRGGSLVRLTKEPRGLKSDISFPFKIAVNLCLAHPSISGEVLSFACWRNCCCTFRRRTLVSVIIPLVIKSFRDLSAARMLVRFFVVSVMSRNEAHDLARQQRVACSDALADNACRRSARDRIRISLTVI